jgi:negative modulator of initiation of replication
VQTVEIDDTIYEFLTRQRIQFESPSDVLARLLNLSSSSSGLNGSRALAPGSQSGGQTAASRAESPIAEFLDSSDFLVHGNAVERFLGLLSWLYSQNPDAFAQVLLLNGRKRQYFGRSAEVLEASGRSVMPKKIPDTPYWVVSNNSTQTKRQMMGGVMRLLGYDSSSARMAVEAIR